MRWKSSFGGSNGIPVIWSRCGAMFLAAHSIKGGAAMLGLAEVLREVVARARRCAGALRDHRRTLDPSTADVVLRTVDRLRILLPVELQLTPWLRRWYRMSGSSGA